MDFHPFDGRPGDYNIGTVNENIIGAPKNTK